jgi:hypothetical protein
VAWLLPLLPLAYTIASEVGDIRRFASPKKLTGYTGLCRMYVEQVIATLLRNAAKCGEPPIEVTVEDVDFLIATGTSGGQPRTTDKMASSGITRSAGECSGSFQHHEGPWIVRGRPRK